ncbi:MAG: hypothetical protein V4611_00855 [Patescibacteria group bacterium]
MRSGITAISGNRSFTKKNGKNRNNPRHGHSAKGTSRARREADAAYWREQKLENQRTRAATKICDTLFTHFGGKTDVVSIEAFCTQLVVEYGLIYSKLVKELDDRVDMAKEVFEGLVKDGRVETSTFGRAVVITLGAKDTKRLEYKVKKQKREARRKWQERRDRKALASQSASRAA